MDSCADCAKSKQSYCRLSCGYLEQNFCATMQFVSKLRWAPTIVSDDCLRRTLAWWCSERLEFFVQLFEVVRVGPMMHKGAATGHAAISC